jgi:hypothetical protein
MISSAGLAFEDLAFWWFALGEERGLWDVAPISAATLLDLWADVEVAVSAVREWVHNNEETSYCSFHTACGINFPLLDQTELAGLWGLSS